MCLTDPESKGAIVLTSVQIESYLLSTTRRHSSNSFLILQLRDYLKPKTLGFSSVGHLDRGEVEGGPGK